MNVNKLSGLRRALAVVTIVCSVGVFVNCDDDDGELAQDSIKIVEVANGVLTGIAGTSRLMLAVPADSGISATDGVVAGGRLQKCSEVTDLCENRTGVEPLPAELCFPPDLGAPPSLNLNDCVVTSIGVLNGNPNPVTEGFDPGIIELALDIDGATFMNGTLITTLPLGPGACPSFTYDAIIAEVEGFQLSGRGMPRLAMSGTISHCPGEFPDGTLTAILIPEPPILALEFIFDGSPSPVVQVFIDTMSDPILCSIDLTDNSVTC